jgi:hypothetical protein
MPVPKFVVEQYLTRPVDTKEWYKKLTPLEVEADLALIKPPHKFTIPTFRLDQKVCFLRGIADPETMIMTDLGLGKTGVSLELLSYFYTHGFIRRAFVFTPTDEVCEGWEDEIKKWGFKIPYIRLPKSSSVAKWKKLETFDTGIIIGTFAGVSAMVATLDIMVDKKGNPLVDADGNPTGKKKRQIKKDLILKLIESVDAVVFDQSTKLGNRESLQFQVCNEFSVNSQIRYSLAGRAYGRDPFILWSQFYVTDRGKAFGTSPGLFREAFFRRVEHSFATTWEFRKRRAKIFQHYMLPSSIQYTVEECVDLPPKNYVIKECEFPEENWAYYEKERQALLETRGNWREVSNAFLRMRQISSGFVGFLDDETDERAQIAFKDNPKLNLLMELLEELPEDKKILIFHEFNYSGRNISEELTKRKYKHGWLWGGTKNWTPIKDSFNNDPDYRILVANTRKASMGLNLQAACYTIFYESPVSVIDRYECEGRTYRTGQKEKTFFYDLVMQDSVDEKILQFHAEGKDLYEALRQDPVKIVKGR